MNPRLLRGAAIAATLLCLPLAPARAGIFSDDEARKAVLELRDQITESEKAARERMDAISARIDQLEARLDGLQHGQSEAANRFDGVVNDVAQLRGSNEQLANDLATIQRRQREIASDFDQRLRKLEPQPVTIDGKTADVSREEQNGFENALAQFRASDFRGAIGNLRGFLARFPDSIYAPAAQFWLASSLYAVKDFTGAIAAHQSLVDHYPDSPRVPDALLGIGTCQIELNDRKGARATFTRIGSDFPDSEAARVAKDRLSTLGDDKGSAAKKAKNN